MTQENDPVIAIVDRLNALWQEANKHPSTIDTQTPYGRFAWEAFICFPFIASNVGAAHQELADWRDRQRRVTSEDCSADEKHCACVPILKRRIAELEAERDSAFELVEKMNEAATGNKNGPIRGVVEDVEDLRAIAEHYKAEATALRKVVMEFGYDWHFTDENHYSLEAKLALLESISNLQARLNTYLALLNSARAAIFRAGMDIPNQRYDNAVETLASALLSIDSTLYPSAAAGGEE